MYRSDTDLERCSRFGPGEEDAARAFIGRPSTIPRFWMMPNRLARIYLVYRSWAVPLVVGSAFLFGGAGGASVKYGGEDAWIVWVFMAGMFVAGVGMMAGFALKAGLFVLDPDNEVLRYHRKEFPFRRLGLPRATTATMMVTRGDLDTLNSRDEAFSVLMCGRLTFFNGETLPRPMIETIADKLNAMLAEYHEREEVRAWLERRDAATREPASAAGSPTETKATASPEGPSA